MNSKLTILANGKPLTLKEDASISIELKNLLFNDTEMFSYPVELPIEGNRHFLKNVDDVSSDIRPVNYEHTPMQIIADGVPFASGTAIIQEDERLEDSLSLNVDASTQSFADLIGDIKCNEVPIPTRYQDKLLIGEKIDEVNVAVNYYTDVVIKYQGKKGDKKYGSVGAGDTKFSFSPQALGFSYPAKCQEEGDLHCAVLDTKNTRTYYDGTTVKVPVVTESYINVTDSYPAKLFCNARVCYAHHDIDKDGTTTDSLVKTPKEAKNGEMYEDRGPLWVLEADRPQSGICFYILFFLDCLFEHLGVQFDNSALKKIGDINRLCFFTTKCAYDTKPLYFASKYEENDPDVIAGKKKEGDIKLGFFQKAVTGENNIKDLFTDVNKWLDSRGCGGKLSLESPTDKTVQQIVYYPVSFKIKEVIDERFPNKVFKEGELEQLKSDSATKVTVGLGDVESITTKTKIKGAQMSASIVNMYANEKNFPEEAVSDVIDSLEQQFGIKFHYDYEQHKVTAYLIRDVFRDQKPTPRTFNAQILSMTPMTEKITGVRAGYAAESEKKEQQDNIKNKVKDYNTEYDYIDYPKESTITNLTYTSIIHEVYNNQMNVFIDRKTGNKYRVKIDSDFTDANDMEPRLFEVAAYKGVEIGDCSTANEDFIQEFKSSFVPIPLIDTNYRNALAANFDRVFFTEGAVQPTSGSNIDGNMATAINGHKAEMVLAAYVDEDMEHEFVRQYIKNSMSTAVADFYITEELCLRENYDPSSTDDGNSPLQSHDWGLTIAVMRGGGVDSSHEAYEYNYDGFGNSKWRTTAGKYAMTADSIDCYGNDYDNGSNNEEHFSLKPRAWVQPEWAEAPIIINDPYVKNRGYVDTFLIDYIYFLINRKKYYIECLASVAQIADIQNHWKEWWNINGKKCLINKVNTEVSVSNGLDKVEIEVYAM